MNPPAWKKYIADVDERWNKFLEERKTMIDPFTASKRAAEHADRTKMLAADARAALNKLDWDWRSSWPAAVGVLMEIMSVPDAYRVLEFIDWEDSHGR